MILKTELNSRNIITTINTIDIPVVKLLFQYNRFELKGAQISCEKFADNTKTDN